MRDAKISDNWRRLDRRVFRSRVDSVDVSDILGFSSCRLYLDKGLTVLAGANGAGKSTLLDAIYCGLSGCIADRPWVNTIRFSYAKIAVNCTIQGEECLLIFPRQASGEQQIDTTFTKFDPGNFARYIRDSIYRSKNFSDLLEGAATKILKDDQLALVSYLTGKNYSKFQVFEIESFDGSEVPYFSCECDGAQYSGEDMGLGELASLCLFWLVERQVNDSIILVEEPEVHVAYKSQRRLFHYLALRSLEKGLWMVISTHSSAVLGTVPLAYIKLIERHSGVTRIISPPSEQQLRDSLDLSPIVKLALLVEDTAAHSFLTAIVRRHCPSIARRIEIVALDGEGAIQSALRSYPKSIESFRIFGIFDGGFSLPAELADQTAILPGDVPPDALIRQLCDKNIARIAASLGIPDESFAHSLAALSGHDHHQWLADLCRITGFSTDQIFWCVYRILDDFDPVVQSGRDLAYSLERLIPEH